jgi:hypothetical protein
MVPRISPEAVAEEATAIVREAVIASRAALGGLKQAVPDVARRYGLSERRVQSYWWNRVTFVAAHEHKTILAAQKRDLALRELRQAHALEMTRAALANQQKSDSAHRDAGGAAAGGLRGWAEACLGAGSSRGPAQGSLNLGFAFGRR